VQNLRLVGGNPAANIGILIEGGMSQFLLK
jgi:hypothetical protein